MMMSGPDFVSMADAIRGFRSFMLIWSTVTSTPASFPNSAARRLNSTSEAGTKLTHSRTLSRSEEHTSELQSQSNLVCRLLLEKKKKKPQKPLSTIDSDSE